MMMLYTIIMLPCELKNCELNIEQCRYHIIQLVYQFRHDINSWSHCFEYNMMFHLVDDIKYAIV